MNVSKNPSGQLPARLLAQMRMVATKANLSPVLASAFADGAAERNMPIELAEKAVKGLIFLSTTPTSRTVDDATLVKLTDEFLTAVMGGDPAQAPDPKKPTDPTALASEILLAHLVGRDEQTSTRNFLPMAQGHSWDSPQAINQKIADARAAVIAPRLGLKHEATIGRDMGGDTLSHARAWLQGQNIRLRTDAEALDAFVTGRLASPLMAGASHTRGDFATIAGSAVQIVLGRALEQAPVGLALCAHKISATDWRARKLANTSAASGLSEVKEGGEVTFGTIDDKGETIPAPANLAKAFNATEQLLRDAQSGGYDLEAAIARALLEAAQEAQRSVLAQAITANAVLADGLPVFSATRGNVAASAGALGVTTLSAARAGMQRFVDTRGAARPVVPSIILVPPELQTIAEQVVAQITAAKTSDVNPFAGKLEVIADPGLSGSGTYHWYVLPDPTKTDGLALITLEDMPTPKVESRDAWPNFGMTWRVQWPLAAAFVRPSWYRTEGA